MRLADFYLGQIVRFHPIIGLKHDGKRYQIRALGAMYGGGPTVAWLVGKSGAVALEALSVDEREFPLQFPQPVSAGAGPAAVEHESTKGEDAAAGLPLETRNSKPET